MDTVIPDRCRGQVILTGWSDLILISFVLIVHSGYFAGFVGVINILNPRDFSVDALYPKV